MVTSCRRPKPAQKQYGRDADQDAANQGASGVKFSITVVPPVKRQMSSAGPHLGHRLFFCEASDLRYRGYLIRRTPMP
jgi:hypothetical protein